MCFAAKMATAKFYGEELLHRSPLGKGAIIPLSQNKPPMYTQIYLDLQQLFFRPESVLTHATGSGPGRQLGYCLRW